MNINKALNSLYYQNQNTWESYLLDGFFKLNGRSCFFYIWEETDYGTGLRFNFISPEDTSWTMRDKYFEGMPSDWQRWYLKEVLSRVKEYNVVKCSDCNGRTLETCDSDFCVNPLDIVKEYLDEIRQNL